MSDSSFAAQTRHRRPLTTAGRPPVLDVVDDNWASETLSDDDIDVKQLESSIAPLLEEGELDADAVVVSSSQSGSGVNSAAERRRREEGRWNDLALDYFDSATTSSSTVMTSGPGAHNNASQRQ